MNIHEWVGTNTKFSRKHAISTIEQLINVMFGIHVPHNIYEIILWLFSGFHEIMLVFFPYARFLFIFL